MICCPSFWGYISAPHQLLTYSVLTESPTASQVKGTPVHFLLCPQLGIFGCKIPAWSKICLRFVCFAEYSAGRIFGCRSFSLPWISHHFVNLLQLSQFPKAKQNLQFHLGNKFSCRSGLHMDIPWKNFQSPLLSKCRREVLRGRLF